MAGVFREARVLVVLMAAVENYLVVVLDPGVPGDAGAG